MLSNGLKAAAFNIMTKIRGPSYAFRSNQYLRHNARRLEHLASLRIPVAGMSVLEVGAGIGGGPFDLVHCYGLLYPLSRPAGALTFLSENATGMLFLETCVSFGDGEEINPIGELQSNPTQAYSATGCRPTRIWLFNRLRDLF